MSTIYVNMSNVPGDATQTDFLNQIQCSAILQDFSQPVESAANPRAFPSIGRWSCSTRWTRLRRCSVNSRWPTPM